MAVATAPPRLGKRPRCADPTIAADCQDGGWKRRVVAVEVLAASGSPATPASFVSTAPPGPPEEASVRPPVDAAPSRDGCCRPVAVTRASPATPPTATNRYRDQDADDTDDADVPSWLQVVGRRPAASDVRFLHAITSVIEDCCERGPSANDDDVLDDDALSATSVDVDDDSTGTDDDASAFSDVTAADAADEAIDALVSTFDATDSELAAFPTPDDYVAHLASAGGISTAAFLMAWVYMGRACGHHENTSIVSEMTLRRLLAAGVRLAVKVLDEPVCSAAAWARIAGLDGGAAEVARCELALLRLVHWGVHVGARGYADMANLVCGHVGGMGGANQDA
ncbi:hypothetical protein MMPV_009042 [Pyropia vietnamensis]